MQLKSHLSCLFILLIVFALLIDVQSQRGGGSSSRSRSSYSSSSRRSSWGGGYRSSSYYGSSAPMTWLQTIWSLVIMGGILGTVFCIFICTSKQKLGTMFQSRKSKVKRITDQFQMRNQANQCSLSQQQRNNTIDWFMSKQWKVQFRMNNGSNQGQYQFYMKDIVKRTDYVYEIQAQGNQFDLGRSVLRGILLFQGSYLSICFDKQYDNKTNAGQTGQWDMLIYQGVQQGQEFAGVWYYQNFRYDSQYSGQMRMIHN